MDEIYRASRSGRIQRNTEFNDTVIRYRDKSVVGPRQARDRFEEADDLIVIPCMHKQLDDGGNQISFG
jgi:hypothetical protein